MKSKSEKIQEDELMEKLAALSVYDIDSFRNKRIRDQSHAILARNRRRSKLRQVVFDGIYDRVLEPSLVSGLAIAYIIWALQKIIYIFRG